MSYLLPHLPSGWHVDEAIKSEEDRIVVIRFGHDWDTQCMTMDETLYGVAEKVQNFAVIYLVDITEVPDFNKANMIDIIETVYRGASKGRGLVVSPKDYSTRYRY
ncbi:Thioredoxin-like protein 4A [Termitomyces sp. J132]|nr:Thioredoxin-like protein 4A [Termitomyces sp. J132]